MLVINSWDVALRAAILAGRNPTESELDAAVKGPFSEGAKVCGITVLMEARKAEIRRKAEACIGFHHECDDEAQFVGHLHTVQAGGGVRKRAVHLLGPAVTRKYGRYCARPEPVFNTPTAREMREAASQNGY